MVCEGRYLCSCPPKAMLQMIEAYLKIAGKSRGNGADETLSTICDQCREHRMAVKQIPHARETSKYRDIWKLFKVRLIWFPAMIARYWLNLRR